jgi:hypothetical protein
MELNNAQVNALISAAYALTNRLGRWFNEPSDGEEQQTLEVLAVVQNEITALFAACPNLRERQHTPEEVDQIAQASIALMSKLANSYKDPAGLPASFRKEARQLFSVLIDTGLIKANPYSLN